MRAANAPCLIYHEYKLAKCIECLPTNYFPTNKMNRIFSEFHFNSLRTGIRYIRAHFSGSNGIVQTVQWMIVRFHYKLYGSHSSINHFQMQFCSISVMQSSDFDSNEWITVQVATKCNLYFQIGQTFRNNITKQQCAWRTHIFIISFIYHSFGKSI